MAKIERVGKPAEQAVPWGAATPQFSEEGNAQVTPEKTDAVEPFEAPTNVATEVPTWKPETPRSPFGVKPQKSPFAPKPKAPEPEPPKLYPLSENDPSWIELVRFCQKHGDVIIQAHYPHPRGECIDTIYRGVTVFAHPTTQVRHRELGWIDWQDAIYE